MRPNQSAMTNILLSGESIDKTKEADTFAFLITDVIIPGGMSRVDVAGCLAAAGIYSSEDDVAYGKGESDERNERMVLKAVGHLGHSDHKYNPPALAQLAAAWPASRPHCPHRSQHDWRLFVHRGRPAYGKCLRSALQRRAVDRSCLRRWNQLDFKYLYGWAHGSVHTQPAAEANDFQLAGSRARSSLKIESPYAQRRSKVSFPCPHAQTGNRYRAGF